MTGGHQPLLIAALALGCFVVAIVVAMVSIHQRDRQARRDAEIRIVEVHNR